MLMSCLTKALWTCALVCLGLCLVGIDANAQSLALRSGETFELGEFWYVSKDCKSLLVGLPKLEIMDGPPGVSVAIKEAMVTPHAVSCANPVRGAKIMISAKDVDSYSQTQLVVRIMYQTRNGERQATRRFTVSLFP